MRVVIGSIGRQRKVGAELIVHLDFNALKLFPRSIGERTSTSRDD